MADVSVINVTSLTPIVAAAIVSGQQVTIYDQGGIGYRAEVQELVGAAQRLNGCQCVKTATLNIPTAQVLTLGAVPKGFGISVPSGYYIQPLSIQMKAIFNTTPYATNVGLQVYCANSTGYIATEAAALSFSAPVFMNFALLSGADNIGDGGDVEVFVPAGNPTAGDSDITLVLTYILLPTP